MDRMTEREVDNAPNAAADDRTTVTALRGALERVQRQLEQETREKHQALRDLHDARVNLRAFQRPTFGPAAPCSVTAGNV